MSRKKHAYSFNSVDLLIYMWDKRSILIIVSVFAAVLSIIVSFQITPMFKSTVVMFPTTDASVSKSLIFGGISNQASLYAFGEEEQAEQLLQILNSDRIRDRIIAKYNLMEHYEIESGTKFPYTHLYEMYNSNISFRPTEFMSIKVEVMDKDPQMAADIANDIASLVDTVYNEIKMERAQEALKIVEQQYILTEQKVLQLKDSLAIMGKLGVSSYGSQIDRYSEGYSYALKEGQIENARALEKKINQISGYSGTYFSLMNRLNTESDLRASLKIRMIEAQIETNSTLSHRFLVDKAQVAEKKSYPKKSLIVVISTLSAFLITLLFLIVNDNLHRRLDYKKR